MMEKQQKDLNRFRDNLLRISGERNITQAEIGRRIGYTRHAINKWFRGLYVPSILILPRLAKALNCTLDELLEGIE